MLEGREWRNKTISAREKKKGWVLREVTRQIKRYKYREW